MNRTVRVKSTRRRVAACVALLDGRGFVEDNALLIQAIALTLTEARMRWRFPDKTRFGRTLGITLVIFSLVHTPLPEPDFHNIRHHDADGEVCDHHDHLLRWHPGAGFATDVAVLHWHWFLPSTPGTAALPVDSGMAMHAHVPAWQAGVWESGPRVMPDSVSRLAMRPVEGPLEWTLAIPGPTLTGHSLSPGAHSPMAFSATFAPGISLSCLLNRWLC